MFRKLKLRRGCLKTFAWDYGFMGKKETLRTKRLWDASEKQTLCNWYGPMAELLRPHPQHWPWFPLMPNLSENTPGVLGRKVAHSSS